MSPRSTAPPAQTSLRRVERKRACEHCEPAEEHALLAVEQVVAPADRRTQASAAVSARSAGRPPGCRGSGRAAPRSAPARSVARAPPPSRERAACLPAARRALRSHAAIGRRERRIGVAARERNSSTDSSRARARDLPDRSPLQRNRSRLVARIVTSGHRSRSVSASAAHASTTCSHVSSTSSDAEARELLGDRLRRGALRGTRIRLAVGGGVADECRVGDRASSTKNDAVRAGLGAAPRQRSQAASSRCRQAPSTSGAASASSSTTAASSRSRPTKLVSSGGSPRGANATGSSAGDGQKLAVERRRLVVGIGFERTSAARCGAAGTAQAHPAGGRAAS